MKAVLYIPLLPFILVGIIVGAILVAFLGGVFLSAEYFKES